MKKIIVFCPPNVATGGPLLLHQICYELRNMGYDSYMYYYKSDKDKDPVAIEYKKFNNQCIDYIEDREENIYVIPEIYAFFLATIKRAKCVFWWLSVDGYYNEMGQQIFQEIEDDTNVSLKKILTFSKVLYNKNLRHLVQSHYAWEHCKQIGIAEENIEYLSDYLDSVFIKNAIIGKKEPKKNIILYNPKKGYKFTKLLIEASPQFVWVPLINFTPEKMANVLKKAKLYIDFGEHPGKDRIPREAVVSGCCLITGKKGSARNKIDIPIPTAYKFDDDENKLDLIIDKIQDIFNSYEDRYIDFFSYKKIILEEEKVFKRQLKKIFEGMIASYPAGKRAISSELFLKNAYKKLQSKE